jgi:hypothetical protein
MDIPSSSTLFKHDNVERISMCTYESQMDLFLVETFMKNISLTRNTMWLSFSMHAVNWRMFDE